MAGTIKSSKKAERRADEAAAADREARLSAEERLKRERERSQGMFIRKIRARSGGGFFSSGTSDTLG